MPLRSIQRSTVGSGGDSHGAPLGILLRASYETEAFLACGSLNSRDTFLDTGLHDREVSHLEQKPVSTHPSTPADGTPEAGGLKKLWGTASHDLVQPSQEISLRC